MSEFHFIRPLWFIALIPMALLLWQLGRQKQNAGGWQQIIPPHLVNHLIQGQSTARHQPFWLLALVWFIIVTALAGPAWEKLPQPVYQTNTGKVIVMDMSMSMRSTDLNPDRLTKARFKAIDLIEKIDDADMGLVAYSGDAFVISPLTADSKNLTALVPSLSPEIMPIAGSNPITGLMMADSLLKNAGYAKGDIFLLTDGIESHDLETINDFIKSTEHRISVLGIGTPAGAPVKLEGGELLKDQRGSIVIPKLDDSPLRHIAKSTGGVYNRITTTDIDIRTLAKQESVSKEAKKDEEQRHQGDQFKEFGPLLVLLILPFAAYAFRRGLVVCFALALSFALPQKAHAGWWQDLWQTKDQQAQQQFAEQNYSDAATTFKDPQWKGSSLYKSGDYEGALAEFQKSDSADSKFNQGNAHTRLGQLDDAIEAYKKALELDPDMEDAKKNLEVAEKLKEQQQQQQQNQEGEQNQEQQNQDQQNQDGQGQQGEGEQGENQDSEQQEQQQSEQQDGEQEQDNQDPQSRQNEQQQGENEPNSRKAEKDQGEGEEDQDAMEQKKPGEEQEGEQGEQQEQAVKPSDRELTNEEKEQMQEIQQLLRKVKDDPSILLRNKMRLEYQKRKYQQQQNTPPGAKSW